MAAVTTRRATRQLIDERATPDTAGVQRREPAIAPAFLRGGNAAAVALLARVQPKLRVGPAGDSYEQEADAIAARVVRSLAANRGEQEADEREGDEGGAASDAFEQEGAEHEGEQPVQRTVRRRVQRKAAPAVGAAGGDIDAATEQAIQRARGGGSPLAAPTREKMEGAFGADFSGVRVHTGGESTRLNDTIQAKAFTLGNDLFFRGSAPDTSSADGQRLLAHELTHTLQQSGSAPAVQRWSLFGTSEKDKKVDKAKDQEKAEKERLKAERLVGTKQRAMMTESYGGDPAALGKLQQQFDKALTDESELRKKLVAAGKTPDEAETEAYQKIWLDAPAGLRALRPMRETRAEKLVSKTAQTRGEVAAAESSKQGVKEMRGALLSKKIEDLFVQEVKRAKDLMARGIPLASAQQQAYNDVWLKVDAETLTKRPAKGSKLEKAAYEHAEKRAGRPDPESSGGTDVLGLVNDVGGGITKVTGGVGKITNKLSTDGNKKTLSVGEQAGGGIDSISSMVSSVLSTVTGIRDFVVLVDGLVKQDSVDYNDIANAIKSALDQLKGLNDNVGNGMRIASSLSESALASLAGVIPIVDVISNSIALASNVAEALPNSMRYGVNLADVYLARANDRSELVLVQKRLGQRNAQLLEQSLYKTTSTLTKLMLGIAQIASGGADMGATTAIKTAVTVIDGAHSLAHMIADTVFAVQAKGARKQYFGAHSEGSAEELLRRDAGFAIDALLTAATTGDKTTQTLARHSLKGGYGIELKKGDTAEITVARERMFKILGESSDPKTMLDKLKEGVAKLQAKGTAWSDAAADVSTLAAARTAEDGKERGFRWKMKMWFKSNGALARRIAQHNAEQGTSLETSKTKRTKGKTSTGDDPNITSPKLQQSLIDEMDGMDSKALFAAAKDPKRSQFEKIVFSQAAAEKLKEEMTGEKVKPPKKKS